MILNHFDKKVSYDEIKSLVKMDNDGTSAYELIKASKKYGVNATGYKNYIINESSVLPLIAHTVQGKTQHFVVVRSINNNKLKIEDPSKGLLYVSLDEFKKVYTGIAIIFQDDHSLAKKEIFNKKIISLITFIILFLALLNVTYSYLLSYIVENFKYKKEIICVLIMFLSVGITKEIFGFVKERVLLKYQLLIDRVITIPTLKKIINLPHNFYQKRPVGELISKINDLSYIKEMIFVLVQVLFVNMIIIIISLIFLLLNNYYVLLLNILVIITLIIYNKYFFIKHSYKNYDLQIKNEILNSKISNSINSIISVKNLCKEKYLINALVNSYEDTINDYRSVSKLYQCRGLMMHMFILFSFILSIFLMFYSDLRISSMLFVTYLEMNIYDSLYSICDLVPIWADFKGALIRIREVYKEKEIDNNTKVFNINNVCFKNVSYKYDKKNVFDNVNLTMRKGDFILINGPSGCGKTTIFKLLTKQIKSNGYGVLINNKNINSYPDGMIRRSITYVDQKIRLFNDTVLENITLGSKLTLRSNVKLLLDNFLKKNNISYDTMIDNTNSNLSGGQIAFISSMQALNNGGEVIIFDETTSQMDTFLERKLINAIKADYKDKIVVFISHRLSNKDLFSKIINFNGKNYNYKRRKNEKIKN